jgi:hypothetical protein
MNIIYQAQARKFLDENPDVAPVLMRAIETIAPLPKRDKDIVHNPKLRAEYSGGRELYTVRVYAKTPGQRALYYTCEFQGDNVAVVVKIAHRDCNPYEDGH